MEDKEVTQNTAGYAFPHTNADESRRLDLLAERLDPVTKRRIGQLGLDPAVRCLEIGAGRGSIATWLAPSGWLVAEEADFGMWLADLDPAWAAHPAAWHEAFPNGSLSQGRALL